MSSACPDIVVHAARKLIVAIYSRRDREKSSAQVRAAVHFSDVVARASLANVPLAGSKGCEYRIFHSPPTSSWAFLAGKKKFARKSPTRSSTGKMYQRSPSELTMINYLPYAGA